MTKKYTPGPWEFNMDRDTHDYVVYQKGAVENPYGYIDEGGVIGSSEWTWVEEADARLISCAPELLEALEEAVDGLQWLGSEYPQSKIDKMLQLIAKAKGEPS